MSSLSDTLINARAKMGSSLGLRATDCGSTNPIHNMREAKFFFKSSPNMLDMDDRVHRRDAKIPLKCKVTNAGFFDVYTREVFPTLESWYAFTAPHVIPTGCPIPEMEDELLYGTPDHHLTLSAAINLINERILTAPPRERGRKKKVDPYSLASWRVSEEKINYDTAW